MDWLRIGAFGLLIFYHIGMIFVPWDFHINAEQPVEWLEYPMLALNPWRLPLLFLVSGFASRNLLQKLISPGAFMASRTRRLLIPLIFGMAITVPPQPWVELIVKHGYSADYWTFITTDYFHFNKLGGLDLPTWNHLWFVTYLFVYTGLLVLIAMPLNGRAAWLQRTFDMVFGGWRVIVVPVLIFFLIRQWLYPVYDESHALIGDWAAHALYGFSFFFGFGMARSVTTWTAIRQHHLLAYAIAIVGGAIFLGTETLSDEAVSDTLLAGARFARSLFAWGMIVSLIAIADRYWDHDRPSRSMWVEAVFPFYIIHQTIIILVYWWMMELAWPWPMEFAVIVTATVAGCWVFYRLGREVPGLRMLIGLSGFSPPKKVAPADG